MSVIRPPHALLSLFKSAAPPPPFGKKLNKDLQFAANTWCNYRGKKRKEAQGGHLFAVLFDSFALNRTCVVVSGVLRQEGSIALFYSNKANSNFYENFVFVT